MQTFDVPNDYSHANPFCGTATTTGAFLDLINAPQAWGITQGNPGIIIGIVDVGFDSTQEDLVNKFITSPYTLTPAHSGGSTHATEVAGVAACETNNNKGYASIGNKCKFKFFDWLYPGILLAAQNNCKIINCSWLGSCVYNQDEQDLIDVVHDDHGAVIVAAAGNGLNGNHCGTDGNGYVYPASYNHVISVTTVGHMFDKNIFALGCGGNPDIGFSWKDYHDQFPNARDFNMPTKPNTHNNAIDLCAPGYAVPIEEPGNSYSDFGGYGTSYSSPMVAGAAALILSVNPGLTPDDVDGILKCSARDLYEIPENFFYLNQLGAGRLDAYKALQLAQTWVPGTGDVQNATPTDIRWFDILSDGTNTVEEETTCQSTMNPGKCNIGYRLQAVGIGTTFKWLVYYSDDNINNGVPTISSIKYGNSIILTRGSDYPAVNTGHGKISIAVRVNDCLASNYYEEDKLAACFDPTCTYPCNSNITITGTYSTAITESSTWIKSSGQTTISGTASIKLDAQPTNGYILFQPSGPTDYFLAAPSTSIGVFVAQPLDGCGGSIPARPALANVGNNSEFEIYPNPVNDLINLKYTSRTILQEVSIELEDANGKLVYKSSIHPGTFNLALAISTAQINSGIYFLTLKSGNYLNTKKVVVIK